jgi:hypothetical protein
MEYEEYSFKMRKWPLYGSSLLVSAIAICALSGFKLFLGHPIQFLADAHEWLAVPVATLLASSTMALSLKTIVASTGISGSGMFGKDHFFEWDEIERVRPFSFLGLSYARVYRKSDGKMIYIPLFVERPQRFKQAVERFAPEGNAFREYVLGDNSKGVS